MKTNIDKSKRFYINIWDDCNLRCKHCFNESGKVRGKLLSHSEIIDLIDDACDCIGIKEVQMTGGEPTQRPDLFKIIRKLQQKEIKIILQTNGVFGSTLTNEILKLPEESTSLIVSLDGIETNDYFRGKGSTDKIINNLEILSKKFNIRINTLLSSRIKWSEVETLSQLTKKLGLTLAFNPICPSGRASSSLLMPPNKYFEWMHKLENLRKEGVRIRKCFDFIDNHLVENEECPVRKGTSIHIAADGDTYPCGFLVNNLICFSGSIRELSLTELMKRIPHCCKVLPQNCRGCDFYANGYCHGGCPARIYSLYKRFDEVDMYCMAKYFQQNKK